MYNPAKSWGSLLSPPGTPIPRLTCSQRRIGPRPPSGISSRYITSIRAVQKKEQGCVALCCVNNEQNGFLLQYGSNGGDDGTEKEKPDDRSETRGGFETVTERMQNLTSWFVSDYGSTPETIPFIMSQLTMICARYRIRRKREIHHRQTNEDHPSKWLYR